MKDTLQTFAFDSHAIRVVGTPEEPLFVGSDVASALGFNHAPSAYRSLDDDEKGVQKVYTPGGEQEMTIITESGLYSLILRSNKPEAKVFKRWVTHDVLPSIRKKGFYASKKKIDELEATLSHQNEHMVKMYRRLLFGGYSNKFIESRWIWRLYSLHDSFSKVANEIGWTASKVSNRYKKYKHYLDATRIERKAVKKYAADDLNAFQIHDVMQGEYQNWSSFLLALHQNDHRINHLKGENIDLNFLEG